MGLLWSWRSMCRWLLHRTNGEIPPTEWEWASVKAASANGQTEQKEMLWLMGGGKRLGNQHVILRLGGEIDNLRPPFSHTDVLAPGPGKPIPSDLPNSARSLSPYLTLGTVTLTGHRRPTKVTFPRSYPLHREWMYTHFSVQFPSFVFWVSLIDPGAAVFNLISYLKKKQLI